MENLEFPSENATIQATVGEMNQLKAKIACSVASLQEEQHRRPQLEIHLSKCLNKIKELNAQQYNCFKEKVDLEFQSSNAAKMIEKNSEIISSISKDNEMVRQRLRELQIKNQNQKRYVQQLSEKEHNLSVYLSKTNNSSIQMTKQLQAFKEKENNLEELISSKSESVKKLKDLKVYLQQKTQQLSINKIDVSNELAEKVSQNIMIQNSIEKLSQIVGNRLLSSQNTFEQIESYEEKIDHQLFNQKLLRQKLLILQQKVETLHSQNHQKYIELDKKKKEKENKMFKKRQNINNWLQHRQQIQVNTSHSRHYINRVRVN